MKIDIKNIDKKTMVKLSLNDKEKTIKNKDDIKNILKLPKNLILAIKEIQDYLEQDKKIKLKYKIDDIIKNKMNK